MTTIEQIQTLLGVTVDGIWGPVSQADLIASDAGTKEAVQAILGVTADGDWGPVSQTALNAARGRATDFRPTKFSSFADPADVESFKRCKRTGQSDVACFEVGDNGIGQFGQVTAQDSIPMVAVHASEMVARWGSTHGAAHRPVLLRRGAMVIEARVEDRISAAGRVDLNPAAARQLGLTPPFIAAGEWKWKEDV